MFKIYSKGCQYALRLMMHIPLNDSGEKFLAADLCKKAKVPLASSRKVLQQMVQLEYLQAVPGPGGGYRLLKDPQKVSLLDIVKLIEGNNVFDECVMGLSQCSSINPCPVHTFWMKIKEEMMREMGGKTLFDLMKSADGKTRRKRLI